MRYLAAYCLLNLSGKSEVSEKDLVGVLSSIGAEAKEETAKVVCGQLKGKQVHELAQAGLGKISSMVVSSGPVCSAPTGGKAQEVKQEKPKTQEEEEDVDIGDLFG